MVRVPLSLISGGTRAAACLSTEVLTWPPFWALPLSSEFEPQPARATEATSSVAATREILRMSESFSSAGTGRMEHPATRPGPDTGSGRLRRGLDAPTRERSALLEGLHDRIVDGVLGAREPVLGRHVPPDRQDDQRAERQHRRVVDARPREVLVAGHACRGEGQDEVDGDDGDLGDGHEVHPFVLLAVGPRAGL